MTIVFVGIDLAKNVFAVHGVNEAGKAPLAGSSVYVDRGFLAQYLPELDAYMHYRLVDVSTLKELARRWRPEVVDAFNKRQAHTALADVHESIDELEHYRARFIRMD